MLQDKATGDGERAPLESILIDKKYRYWRIRIFYSMYIGYAFYYFTRKGLVFVLPALIKDLHFTKVDIGLLGTIFYLVYGVSKFFSGMVSDRVNPRYFMAVGLIITGITNILFGFSSTLSVMLLLWLVNSVFQGWGWPPCAKLLTHWYSQRERGIWWGIWNTSHTLGAAIIPVIAGFCASYWGWRTAMFCFGVSTILVGVFVFYRFGDVPEKMGLPHIEDYKQDYPAGVTTLPTEKISVKQVLIKYILTNKYIWVLAFSSFIIYFVRTAFIDWGSLYLTHKGYTLIAADNCLSFFEWGGLFGSILAGLCSDKIFRGRRGPVNVLFSIFIVISIIGFWAVPGVNFFLQATAAFFLGLFVFGPQLVLGIAAAELSYREAAGTATGFLAVFAYIGAALSGYPVGMMLEHYSWNSLFVVICLASLVSIALLIPMWPVTTRKA